MENRARIQTIIAGGREELMFERVDLLCTYFKQVVIVAKLTTMSKQDRQMKLEHLFDGRQTVKMHNFSITADFLAYYKTRELRNVAGLES